MRSASTDAARIGFGVSGPLGQRWFSEAKTAALIDAALAQGVTHFDTAPFYFGAEERLGRALGKARADVFISTKTGTLRKGLGFVKNFEPEAIRADVDVSRKRLARDRLDLLYLHGPSTEEIDKARATLDRLVRDGAVAAIGVCGAGAPLAHAVKTGFGAVMGVLNLIDRRHEDLFAEAKEKGVMTVAIAPLMQGVLSPSFHRIATPADAWRIARAALRPAYPRAAIENARRAVGTRDPALTALGFVLSNPAVDIVMTTTTNPAHLAASAHAKALAPAEYAALNVALNQPSLDPRPSGA